MSEHVSVTDNTVDNTTNDFLHEESQYSGKVYWLNIPHNVDLDFGILRDRLRNRTIRRDSDIDDVDADHVPKIFQQEGKLTETIRIKDINLTQNGDRSVLLGTISIDEPYTVQYQNQDVLILGTTTAKFMIFEFNEQHYIQYLCSREVAEDIAQLMKNQLNDLGFSIQETQLDHDNITVLRNNLNAELIDTEITDFGSGESHGCIGLDR